MAKQQSEQGQDHWSTDAYRASASFVPKLTATVVSWLDPKAHENILDLGCGDGILTAQIKDRCSSVTAIDASPNMIEAARTAHGSRPGLTWEVYDCRCLKASSSFRPNYYDKVFSNAALHWILRDSITRGSVLQGAYDALKPQGIFVFEMGGAGNVAEIHASLLSAIVHQGLTIHQARDACPWFFPSEKLMVKMLEDVGFSVEKSQLEYRPTEFTTDREGGIEGWLRLMGAQFLETLSIEQKEAAVKEVCETLDSVLTHEEDGSKWLGYVRLRMVARKR